MTIMNDSLQELASHPLAAAVVSYYQRRSRPRYAADLPRGPVEWRIFWDDVAQEIQEVHALFGIEAETYAEIIQAAAYASTVMSPDITADLWHKLKTYQQVWQPKWPRPQATVPILVTAPPATPADWQQIHTSMRTLRDQHKISFADNSDADLMHFAQQRFTCLKAFYDFRREIEYAFYTYSDYSSPQQYVSQKYKRAYQAKLPPKAPFILTLSNDQAHV